MSNKTRLQQNNLDLQAVLEQAQKLEGHGQYVWKKSEAVKETSDLTRPIVELTADQIEFTIFESLKVNTTGQLVGSGASMSFLLYGDQSQNITSGEFPYLIWENLAYTEVTLGTSNAFELTGKSVTYQTSFKGYVLSNNKTAYPDGAVHTDGKYYKKVQYAPQGVFLSADGTEAKFVFPDGINDREFEATNGIDTMFNNIRRLTVESKYIGSLAFAYRFTSAGSIRVKIKTEEMRQYPFQFFTYRNSYALPKAWIGKQCTKIIADSSVHSVFSGTVSGMKIYCEAPSKPSGWGGYWNYMDSVTGPLTTFWGVTEEQFDAMA